jgi:DNA ligase 1
LPALYLCANQVAPAYQCVELGIGDAILMRAISEATGSNAVKSKYEQVGDLGTVAQSCKSKQKTLGGFFGGSTKASGSSLLLAHEVLAVFRQIAETKGNQSQKWKVDHIKKLLVKAVDGLESKYIVRGLQGKLRIGLAQSTVLISLGHALALVSIVIMYPCYCAIHVLFLHFCCSESTSVQW